MSKLKTSDIEDKVMTNVQPGTNAEVSKGEVIFEGSMVVGGSASPLGGMNQYSTFKIWVENVDDGINILEIAYNTDSFSKLLPFSVVGYPGDNIAKNYNVLEYSMNSTSFTFVNAETTGKTEEWDGFRITKIIGYKSVIITSSNIFIDQPTQSLDGVLTKENPDYNPNNAICNAPGNPDYDPSNIICQMLINKSVTDVENEYVDTIHSIETALLLVNEIIGDTTLLTTVELPLDTDVSTTTLPKEYESIDLTPYTLQSGDLIVVKQEFIGFQSNDSPTEMGFSIYNNSIDYVADTPVIDQTQNLLNLDVEPIDNDEVKSTNLVKVLEIGESNDLTPTSTLIFAAGIVSDEPPAIGTYEGNGSIISLKDINDKVTSQITILKIDSANISKLAEQVNSNTTNIINNENSISTNTSSIENLEGVVIFEGVMTAGQSISPVGGLTQYSTLKFWIENNSDGINIIEVANKIDTNEKLLPFSIPGYPPQNTQADYNVIDYGITSTTFSFNGGYQTGNENLYLNFKIYKIIGYKQLVASSLTSNKDLKTIKINK